MSKAVLKALVDKFDSHIIDSSSRLGNETAVINRDGLKEIARWLRDDPKNNFDFLRDVTAVDYLGYQGKEDDPRFEVVYMLYSIPLKHSIRLKVPLEESDLKVDTLSDVWRAANWGEREVWDMYGIQFKGHPDLRRVLLYEEFEGHPLRKDYPKRQSQPRLDLLAPERDPRSEFKKWTDESGKESEKSS